MTRAEVEAIYRDTPTDYRTRLTEGHRGLYGPLAVMRLEADGVTRLVPLRWDCRGCGGTGRQATARSANGHELEKHERRGWSPCGDCEASR